LPPAAIKQLENNREGWQITQGACSNCVRSALVDFLMAQGEMPFQERVDAAAPLPAEIAFGVLPTAMRLPSDPRYRGRGITLALVDSGYYPHPDLVQPRNRIRAWADASTDPVTWRVFSPDETPDWPGWDANVPSQWHGMMTSTVAAGNGTMSHGLYRGLASEADLVLVQVTGKNGSISNESITRALKWLDEHRENLGVRVVSVSVAGEHTGWLVGNPVDEAVNTLVRDGVPVVVAAGNEGARRLVPPATAPLALTIGGLDDKNNFDPAEVEVWHSNYGASVTGLSKPELVAPSIRVAAPVLPISEVAEEARELFAARSGHREEAELRIAEQKLITPHYQHVEGTSFAAPLVASVVACMLEANPSLTPQQVRDILTSTAQPVPGAERSRQGAGALEPSRALGLALRAEGGPMIGFPLSPEFSPDGISFCLYDADAASVRVLGSWDDWSEPGIQAEEVQSHVWCAQIPSLPPGSYSYRFLLDGHRWLYDPDNPRKTPNHFGGFDSLLRIEGPETLEIA
jgi:serine protease AprX